MSVTTLCRLTLAFGLSLSLIVLSLGCGTRGKKEGTAKEGVSIKESRALDKEKLVDGGEVVAGNRHALIVGVAGYDNQAFTDLKYTENDAEGLAEALKKPEAGFRVRLLTTSRGKADKADMPTAANIKKAMESLLVKRKKGDVVLIALAGHGVTLELKDPDGKGEPKTYPYFCASDADLIEPRYSTGESDSMVNLDTLFADLGRCGAGTKLVMMDACRNVVTVKAGRRSLDPGGVTIPVGVAALYSASQGRVAYEKEGLGTRGGHGVFFHFAIEGLNGKAKDEEGVVTWAGLTGYVTRQVERNVPTLVGGGAKQTPASRGSLEGDPVLVMKEVKSPEKDGGAVVVADKDKSEKDKSKVEVKKGPEITNSIKMKLVLIPAGKFKMGSPDDEPDRVAGNEHLHDVEISKSFYMGVFEVKQDEWVAVMGEKNNPSGFALEGQFAGLVPKDQDPGVFPVENVTWDEANDFCNKLTVLEKKLGRRYRLPTEAEWEYACRAGTDTPFAFGEKLTIKQANFGAADSIAGSLGRTCKVGSYKMPNAFGLYDMHGNIAEWCSDWYSAGYYKNSPAKDPSGPDEGTERILRGESWNSSAKMCRSAYRGKMGPSGRDIQTGFRVVCEIIPKK